MPGFVTTSGVLLETSCGAITVDMYGADAPLHTADFLNLCRSGAWNGAVVTSVVPDVAVIFGHTASQGFLDALQEALTPRTTEAPLKACSSLFWSLAACGSEEAANDTRHEIQQQAASLTTSLALEEVRRCRQLSVSHLTRSGAVRRPPPAGHTHATAAGSLGRKGLLLAPVKAFQGSPSSGANTVPLLSQFRFALTLADRSMEVLDSEWLAIGEVTEGLSIMLPRLRAAVAATTADSATASTPSSLLATSHSWPRPLRMVRVKHTTVLPTVGAERYLDSRPVSTTTDASTAAALRASGCFAHWASPAAVACAHATLVRAVTHYLAATKQHAPDGTTTTAAVSLLRLEPLPSSSSSRAAAAANASPSAVSIEYEPHYTAEYLSSDEELAADLEAHAPSHDQSALWEPAARQSRTSSSKAQQARRDAARQLHQEKANTTLSLMLNVLNGITDVSGEVRPPENVLFVCKLNPATTGEGLAMVFSQFGKVVSADVITDPNTKQSLCYGFVEFENVETCYRAFVRMDKALVDDCRIHVDFSQSVSKLWAQRQREQRQQQQRQPRPALPPPQTFSHKRPRED